MSAFVCDPAHFGLMAAYLVRCAMDEDEPFFDAYDVMGALGYKGRPPAPHLLAAAVADEHARFNFRAAARKYGTLDPVGDGTTERALVARAAWFARLYLDEPPYPWEDPAGWTWRLYRHACCYRYQCDGDRGWERSKAATLCRLLIDETVSRMADTLQAMTGAAGRLCWDFPGHTASCRDGARKAEATRGVGRAAAGG